MDHPELIALPVLMLADYALTLLGAKCSVSVYRNHFTTPSYELNPLWRKSVDGLRWFNPRHLGLVALICGLLIFVDETDWLPDEVFEVLLAGLFGAFGAVAGRHLANLLVFRYLERHPEEISGRVEMSMRLVLKMSQHTYAGLLPVFALLAALAPNRHTLGVLLGVVAVFVAHYAWGFRARRAAAPSVPD